MKTLKIIIASLALGAASFTAGAQTLLGGAEIGHKFAFGLNVGAGVEYRSMQWFDNSDQWSAEVSASYKILKPLKIGVSYKFIQAHSLESVNSDYRVSAYWANKHRVSVSLTGEWKPFKVLSLSLRERYQYTHRPTMLVPRFDSENGAAAGNKRVNSKSKHILRSRVMAEVKPYKKCRFTPYVSYELYSLLSDVNHTKGTVAPGSFCDKWRLTAGTDFKINKRNSLELFYRYANSSDVDETDSPHTIGLVYSFKL